MHVARMAKVFSMNVLVYDINKDDFLSEIINFKYANLEELLKKSDIVSLHLPYNKYTHHLINKKNISLMKKTSVLINTSRGGIIDTNSLYDALKNKKIAGAGLDVIEGEELIIEDSQIMHKHENHVKLWKTFVTDKSILTLDNVVFTPHNAFNSKEAIDRINKTTTDNIISYLNKKPKNQIN
jgi:D-lactate dehydrogenase